MFRAPSSSRRRHRSRPSSLGSRYSHRRDRAAARKRAVPAVRSQLRYGVVQKKPKIEPTSQKRTKPHAWNEYSFCFLLSEPPSFTRCSLYCFGLREGSVRINGLTYGVLNSGGLFRSE